MWRGLQPYVARAATLCGAPVLIGLECLGRTEEHLEIRRDSWRSVEIRGDCWESVEMAGHSGRLLEMCGDCWRCVEIAGDSWRLLGIRVEIGGDCCRLLEIAGCSWRLLAWRLLGIGDCWLTYLLEITRDVDVRTSPRRARVSITLSRRASATKPNARRPLARTVEMRMSSCKYSI